MQGLQQSFLGGTSHDSDGLGCRERTAKRFWVEKDGRGAAKGLHRSAFGTLELDIERKWGGFRAVRKPLKKTRAQGWKLKRRTFHHLKS